MNINGDFGFKGPKEADNNDKKQGFRPSVHFLNQNNEGDSFCLSKKKEDKKPFGLKGLYHKFISNRAQKRREKELSPVVFETAKWLGLFHYTENRGSRFSLYKIENLAKLTDEEFEKAKERKLFDTILKRGDFQFDGYDICSLAKLTDEEFQRAKERGLLEFRIDENGPLLSGSEISDLAKLDDESYENIEKRNLYPLLKEAFSKDYYNTRYVSSLAKADDKTFNNVLDRGLLKPLRNEEDELEHLDYYEVIRFAELDDETFGKVKERKLFEPLIAQGDMEFYPYEIVDFAKLTDEEFENIKKRALTTSIQKRGKNQFSAYDISCLAKLTDEEFEKAKQFFVIESRPENKQMSGSRIASFAKSDDDKLNRIKYLIQLKNGDEFLESYDISRFSDLSDDEIKRGDKRGIFFPKDKRVSLLLEYYDKKELMKFDDERFNRSKELIYMKERGKNQFDKFDVSILSQTTARKYENAKKRGLLGVIPSLGDRQLNSLEITDLSELTDEEYETAKKRGLLQFDRNTKFDTADIIKNARLDDYEFNLMKEKNLLNINSKRRSDPFSDNDISNFLNLNEEEFNRAQQLFYIPERGRNQIKALEILRFAKLTDEEFNLVKKRGLFGLFKGVKDRSFNCYEASRLIELNDEEFEKAKQCFQIKNRVYTFSADEIARYARLDDETFERIKKLFYIEQRGNNQFDSFDIDEILKLSKEEFERAKKRGLFASYDDVSGKLFNGFAIMLYGKLSDGEFERAKPLFYIDERGKDSQLIPMEITEIAKLDDNEYKRAKELLYIPERKEQQFTGGQIVQLSKLTDEEYEFAKKLFYIKELGPFQTGGDDIILCAKMAKYGNYQSTDEMDLTLKRTFLKDLITQNENLFYSHALDDFVNSKIIPKDKKEYCLTLQKLIQSIGIDTKELNKDERKAFFGVIDGLDNEDSGIKNADFDNVEIQLSYKREDFIKDINKSLSGLSDDDKRKVTGYFGFEIKEIEGNYTIFGYPYVNNTAQNEGKFEDEIKSIKPFVKKFVEENKIIVSNDEKLTQELNSIVEGIPEFLTAIGKIQHKTQSYTLDIHTLKVLQNVINNPKYQKLSNEDKRLLKIAALFHDITKSEGVIDNSHASESAFDTYYILDKLHLSEDEKLKIYHIIKNHEWLKEYNQKDASEAHKDHIARKTAFELRKGDSFKMLSLLTEADLKAVKKNDEFYERFKGAFNSGVSDVEKYLKNIRATSIHLPQTKIPSCDEINTDGINAKKVITKTKDLREIENTVIYLKDGMDLSKLGFDSGVNSDNLNVLMHGLDKEKNSTVFQALGQIDSDAVLSASYSNYFLKNFRGFRENGFIIEVDSDDILAGYYKDFGSGYKKTVDTMINSYINGTESKYRNYASDQIKEYLNLSDEEYVELYEKIKNTPFDEIERKDPKIANVYKKLFSDMEGKKRAHGRRYNEMLVLRPKIKGVFHYGNKDINSIPEYLRIYASENNVPVIYFGE